MAELSYARRAKAILEGAGLAPKKSWGQNFLMDDRVLADIVAAAGVPQGGTVIELGAGMGALTLALLEHGVNVIAVERDRDLIPLLHQLEGTAGAATLTVLPADAARLDYAALAQQVGGPLHILGNLPYQLSGRILVSLAQGADVIADGVVLVQREVGQRLCAEAGTKAYGLLSVLVGGRYHADMVRDVPPGAFLPPPKVQSVVVRLRRRDQLPWAGLAHQGPPEALEAAYVRIARAAFHTRRKTLQNALGLGLGAPKAAVAQVLDAAGIDGSLRAEVLSLEAFARLGAAACRLGLLTS
jgi:16S rRNA (adenine1518-N6/adenine1519-N6)-dimethyltransferase